MKISDSVIMNPKISIIIRCYNEEEHIARLLSGILEQTEKNFEVLVVDSGSTDATLAIASRYPVKIISIKKEDFSFGYSLNVGCELAKGEFLVIVSAHVYPVHHDWLQQLIVPFENERVGLVYGKQRGNDSTKFSEHQILYKWFPDQSNWDQSHPFCNNANASVRKYLWQRFRYDESLTGLEDLAFAKQLTCSGYKIAYEAAAEIIHVHNETAKSLYHRYLREAIAMKEIFPQERFGLFDFFHMVTKNIITDAWRVLRDGMFLMHIRWIIVFRLMQFWGTYRGYARQGTISRQLKDKFYYPNDIHFNQSEGSLSSPIRPIIDYSGLEKHKFDEDNRY